MLIVCKTIVTIISIVFSVDIFFLFIHIIKLFVVIINEYELKLLPNVPVRNPHVTTLIHHSDNTHVTTLIPPVTTASTT